MKPSLSQYVLTLDKAYEMFINRINLKKRFSLNMFIFTRKSCDNRKLYYF